MHARLRRRRDRDRGASAVEYGLMIAAVAAVIVATVFSLGKVVDQAFQTTCSALQSEVQPGCTPATGTAGGGAAPGTGSLDGSDPQLVAPPINLGP